MTAPCLTALRRSIATRARYGAVRWNRIAIIDEAAASDCPERVARAQKLGWTPAGYTLYALRVMRSTRSVDNASECGHISSRDAA